jgi:hypothetical protein
LIRPLPVILIRFISPRCVFCFGMVAFLKSRSDQPQRAT